MKYGTSSTRAFWALGVLAMAAGMACEGPAGPAGADGRDGSAGIDGIDGKAGKDGIVGKDGKDGLNGKEGKSGRNGDAGAPGADGPQGEQGESGEQGEPGEQGAPGVNGLNGDAGVAGKDGKDGVEGRDGRDGRDSVGGGSSVPQVGVPQRVTLSSVGHDRLYGVTYDSEGNIYATGYVSAGINSGADSALVLAKFLPSGELDPTFGNDGVVIYNHVVAGAAEFARGVVVQSTGNIVIGGAVEHDPTATGVAKNDTDLLFVRFLPTGAVDTSFGTNGVVKLDLNNGVETLNSSNTPTLTSGDSFWALSLGANDTLIAHGTQRATGFQSDGTTPRTDADWALVRLQANGALDTSFNGTGKVTLDIGGHGASARAISILADQSIVASGYLNSSVLGSSTQQPVIYKVLANGSFDATFATADLTTQPGVWHDFAVPSPGRAEAYGVALQGDKFVTMGYGPTTSTTGTGSDWVSFRFTAAGVLDTTYGADADGDLLPDGHTYLDPAGQSDNGRFVMTLPDGRVLGTGGGRKAPVNGATAQTDAMVAILTPNGIPDATFAPGGYKLYDLGGNADFFWAGALSPNGKRVAIVGITGAADTLHDDDGALLILPIQ